MSHSFGAYPGRSLKILMLYSIVDIGIDIDIDKTVFKLLIFVLILIRGLTNY